MSEKKKRHGCLSAYLSFILAANIATVIMYSFVVDTVKESIPYLPGWANISYIVFSLIFIVCVIALFKWKKWGFWGIVTTTIIMTGVNLSIGIDTGSAIFGLIGLAILYAVLHIGKANKGWKQLN